MIVITGGAGFIGSVLAAEINRKWNRSDLLIVDKFDYKDAWKNLRNIKFEEYIHADEFIDLLDELNLDQIDFIFHMGACSSTTENDVNYLFKNNTEYSKILFEIATDHNIPFLYASSAATYGDGKLGYSDDPRSTKDLQPLNPYGFSKKLFDDFVLKQKKTPSTWAGFKFFNVFGPNEYHKENMCSLVYKAVNQIKESGEVKLFKSHKDGFEDGKQLRDFVYVKDVVELMLLSARKNKLKGIFNLGTGKANSFYDLVDFTFKAMDKETNIKYIDMPENIRDQYQYYTQAEMDKLLKIFPEFKFKSLQESVFDYVQNYLLDDVTFY